MNLSILVSAPVESTGENYFASVLMLVAILGAIVYITIKVQGFYNRTLKTETLCQNLSNKYDFHFQMINQVSQYVTIDKGILSGTPVFTGTRVGIHSLFDHLKTGVSLEEFLEDFPTVSRKQCEALIELSEKVILLEAR